MAGVIDIMRIVLCIKVQCNSLIGKDGFIIYRDNIFLGSDNMIKYEWYFINKGYLDSKCFDYKAYNGIKDKEDQVIGRKDEKRFK